VSPVRIIGIGSPHGGDQIGWSAIEALQAQELPALYAKGLISMEKFDRPGTLLLEHMRGAELVILIDALVHGGEPGNVLRLRVDEVTCRGSLISAHSVGVAETLALGQVLGDLPDRLMIFGITVGEVGTSDCQAADGVLDQKTQDLLLQGISRELERLYPG